MLAVSLDPPFHIRKKAWIKSVVTELVNGYWVSAKIAHKVV